jgi:hypothetical protein
MVSKTMALSVPPVKENHQVRLEIFPNNRTELGQSKTPIIKSERMSSSLNTPIYTLSSFKAKTTKINTMDNPPNPSEPRRQYTRSQLIAEAQPYYPFTLPDEVFSRVMACGNHRETSPGSGIYEEIPYEEFRGFFPFALPPPESPTPLITAAPPSRGITRAQLITAHRSYPNENQDEVLARVMAFGAHRETEPGSGLYELVSREEFLQHYRDSGQLVDDDDPRMTRYTRDDLIIPVQGRGFLSPDEAFARVMASGNYRETEMGSGLYERVSWEEFLEFARKRRLAQSNIAGAGSGAMDWNL